MITLYVKTGCPYCAKVLGALAANGVQFDEKNIADDGVADELVAKGGKRQVPFMVDGDSSMYESDAIVAHIEEHYGTTGGASKPRIHMTSAHCDHMAVDGKGGCSF